MFKNILRIIFIGLFGLILMGSSVTLCSKSFDRANILRDTELRNVPLWSKDGSKIVFSRSPSGVFVVEVDGSRMWSLPADTPLGTRTHPGNFAPAISPDGSQVAYSIVNRRNYTTDIAISNIDGSDLRRLTNDKAWDSYPAWSPDGSQIAFISGRTSEPGAHLFVMNADGSDLRNLGTTVVLAQNPPTWAPDGSRIAFVGTDRPTEGGTRYMIYTVQPNGSGLASLGESASGATWSPDGTRIAFIAIQVGTYKLSTMAADGTDKIVLRSFNGNTDSFFDYVSWSPAGSEILYGQSDLREGWPVVIVDLDGAEPRIVTWPDGRFTILSAAWSPDGSRIVFHLVSEYSDVVLYTTARDGSDERILVRGNDRSRAFPSADRVSLSPDIRLVAENSDWRNVSADGTACSDGRLVSDPDQNPGLVQDCKTLLSLRNALAGDAVLHLNWTANVPMSRWTGVEIEGLPPRVVELDLAHFRPTQLNGIIPPELGKLLNLRELYLDGNELTGCIPSELHSHLTRLTSDGLGFCEDN